MKSISKKARKAARKQPRRTPEPHQEDVAVDPGYKRRFDRLMDDAISEIKKKPRG